MKKPLLHKGNKGFFDRLKMVEPRRLELLTS